MATHNNMRVFSGSAHPALSRAIANQLNTGLGKIECARFPDGEIRVHIEENVRGVDIFVIQSGCPPNINDALVELLIRLFFTHNLFFVTCHFWC